MFRVWLHTKIYFGLLTVYFIISGSAKDLHAQQVTTPVDSISFQYGSDGRGPYRHREPTWEMKDGIPQVRKTLDVGILYAPENGNPNPTPFWGTGFGVDGTGVEYDTVTVVGEIRSSIGGEALEGVGVNPANAFSPFGPDGDGLFLGGNYLDPGPIYTDSLGRFSKRLLLPVKKDNIVVNDIKEESDYNDVPKTFELHQNYPNPFNPSTSIDYDLNKDASSVKLNIYNILGEKIMTYDAPAGTGKHKVIWDGKLDTGEEAPSGVFLYDLEVDGKPSETKKMIFLK